jgi:hypothetical protein
LAKVCTCHKFADEEFLGLTNVFDHIEDRWFVPDAQIVFPTVFLSDVESLSGNCALYKDCFDIIKMSCNYVILPSNITDFSGLIMSKLREFLGYIETYIRKARIEQWSETEFYRKTGGFLRTVNAFGRNLGDLLTYWNSKKNLFWFYVSTDPALVKKKIMSLVLDSLGIYESLCEEHEVTFSLEETTLSEGYFVLIRNARNSKTIGHFANDADLMILADCMVYSTKRMQQGIVYLVTNDSGLHNTTLAIVDQPKLIFPDITGKLTGLEPLKPRRLIDDFRKRQA